MPENGKCSLFLLQNKIFLLPLCTKLWFSMIISFRWQIFYRKWSWWTSSWSVTSACWSSSSAHARGLVTNVRGRGRRRGWKWRELKLSQHIISCHKLSSQQNLAWWDGMGDGGKRLHKHRSQSVVQFLGFITKCSARLCNCLELFVH